MGEGEQCFPGGAIQSGLGNEGGFGVAEDFRRGAGCGGVAESFRGSVGCGGENGFGVAENLRCDWVGCGVMNGLNTEGVR